MARGEQINRQWRVLQMLQGRNVGLTLRDLSEELEVSERTVQRDFEVLQELGFPIDYEEDETGKRYWTLPKAFLKDAPLVISLTEAVSLHLAEHLLAPLAGTQFAAGLSAILQKIRDLIPDKALDYFKDLEETLHVRRLGTTDYRLHAETVQTVSEAIRGARSVDVSYRAAWRGESYATRFDPYGLVYYDSDLFMVGHSHRAGAVRVFKVPRIVSIASTTHAFKRPTDFKLEDYFRSAFGIVQTDDEPIEVTVRFRGPVATLIEERVWHESQQLEWVPAESTAIESRPGDQADLLATFRLGNLAEFKRWLKGFGAHAEVLSPESLRGELHTELLAAAHQYEPTPSMGPDR